MVSIPGNHAKNLPTFKEMIDSFRIPQLGKQYRRNKNIYLPFHYFTTDILLIHPQRTHLKPE
jgi:hypothetical protein